MDHGSSAPTSRAVKMIFFESGVNAISPGPPKGFEGVSASMPVITSTGWPPSEGMTKRCERRPSFHVSQWRTKIRS